MDQICSLGFTFVQRVWTLLIGTHLLSSKWAFCLKFKPIAENLVGETKALGEYPEKVLKGKYNTEWR